MKLTHIGHNHYKISGVDAAKLAKAVGRKVPVWGRELAVLLPDGREAWMRREAYQPGTRGWIWVVVPGSHKSAYQQISEMVEEVKRTHNKACACNQATPKKTAARRLKAHKKTQAEARRLHIKAYKVLWLYLPSPSGKLKGILFYASGPGVSEWAKEHEILNQRWSAAGPDTVYAYAGDYEDVKEARKEGYRLEGGGITSDFPRGHITTPKPGWPLSGRGFRKP